MKDNTLPLDWPVLDAKTGESTSRYSMMAPMSFRSNFVVSQGTTTS